MNSQFNVNEPITIALENEQETFVVPKALLCNISKYFTNTLDKGFKEGIITHSAQLAIQLSCRRPDGCGIRFTEPVWAPERIC